MTNGRQSTQEHSDGHAQWIRLRADGALGSLRRLLDACAGVARDERRLVVIVPGPVWVPEPGMESALAEVIRLDPGVDAAVGWWVWNDPGPGVATEEGALVVRVGGVSGDDLGLVDLLARPMAIGPIVLRAASLDALSILQGGPADVVLDRAASWLLAAALVGAGKRVGTLPRVCSTRMRSVAEDPERLRPIGLAWLVAHALDRLGEGTPSIHQRRELIARWRASAPIERGASGSSLSSTGNRE
jgi:hypothetical protein